MTWTWTWLDYEHFSKRRYFWCVSWGHRGSRTQTRSWKPEGLWVREMVISSVRAGRAGGITRTLCLQGHGVAATGTLSPFTEGEGSTRVSWEAFECLSQKLGECSLDNNKIIVESMRKVHGEAVVQWGAFLVFIFKWITRNLLEDLASQWE